MGKRPTLTQIAERCGVSIATVSRVLSGKDPVAPATQQKVLRAIRELEHGTIEKKNRRPRKEASGAAPGF